jgi:hypothetical protein
MELVNWIHMAQDRDQWWAVVNTNELSDSIKGEKFLCLPGDSFSRTMLHAFRWSNCGLVVTPAA